MNAELTSKAPASEVMASIPWDEHLGNREAGMPLFDIIDNYNSIG